MWRHGKAPKAPRPVLAWHVCALLLLLSIASGCGTNLGPVADTAHDVNRLPDTTRSIRAQDSRTVIFLLLRLHELSGLDFSGGMAVEEAQITDDGLAELAKLNLPRLDTLLLGWCEHITDAGLEHVSRIQTIQYLELAGNSHIADAGLAQLASMKNLTGLNISGCPGVTDVGLLRLAAKRDWQYVDLSGCENVTADGIAKLRAALPNARIKKDDLEWEKEVKHLRQEYENRGPLNKFREPGYKGP